MSAVPSAAKAVARTRLRWLPLPRCDRGDRLLLAAVRADIAVPNNLVVLAALLGASRRTAFTWRASALGDELLEVRGGMLVPGPSWVAWWAGRSWDTLPAALLRERGLSAPVKAAAAVVWSDAQSSRTVKAGRFAGQRALATDPELAERAGVHRNLIGRARRALALRDLGEAKRVQRGRYRLVAFSARPAPWVLFPGSAAGAERAARAAQGRARGVQSECSGGVQSECSVHRETLRVHPDHSAAAPRPEMVRGRAPEAQDGLDDVPAFIDDATVEAFRRDTIADVTTQREGRLTRQERQERSRVLAATHARDRLERLQEALSTPRGLDYLAAQPVEDQLGFAGFFDRNGVKRRRWAEHLQVALDGRAQELVALVILDVIRDWKVRSVGAVLRRRLLTLLSNKPETALSERAPKTLSAAAELLGRQQTVVVSDDLAQKAASLYRAGLSVEAIAGRLEVSHEFTHAAVLSGLRGCA